MKKILCVCLAVFLLFGSCTLVKAEEGIMPLSNEDNDDYVYRYARLGELDSSKDAYPLSYRNFNGGGCWEGTLYIPKDVISKPYFIHITNSGRISLHVADTTTRHNLDFSVHDFSGKFRVGYRVCHTIRYFWNRETEVFDYNQTFNDDIAYAYNEFEPPRSCLSV